MPGKPFVIGMILIAAVAIGWISLSGIGENLVYYWNPTELKAAGADAQGATIRLGGMVKAGSVQFDNQSTALSFVVTDGTQDVRVEGTGMPPQMFREGIGVVVEGTLREDGVFVSETLLVKHDNEYRAPEEGEAPSGEAMQKMMGGSS